MIEHPNKIEREAQERQEAADKAAKFAECVAAHERAIDALLSNHLTMPARPFVDYIMPQHTGGVADELAKRYRAVGWRVEYGSTVSLPRDPKDPDYSRLRFS